MSKNISGIDVSKHELVIYANEQDFTIGNDEKSLKKWFKVNKDLVSTIDKFVYEPTGGYEKCLTHFLVAHGNRGFMVHANHVRAYAKSLGILAKTDKIDAKMLAQFAQVSSVRLNQPAKRDGHLVGLLMRREQLLQIKKQENNRLETLQEACVKRSIKKHLTMLKRYVDEMDKEIKVYVNKSPELKSFVELLCSIPGVGFLTAVSVAAYLPEIKDSESKALSALSGLAPMNQDSGRKTGKRRIQGGRSQVRRILYMSALTAIRYNPDLKLFYERLSAKGKPFKLAITAVMRKLLTMIRSVAIRGTPWQVAYK